MELYRAKISKNLNKVYFPPQSKHSHPKPKKNALFLPPTPQLANLYFQSTIHKTMYWFFPRTRFLLNEKRQMVQFIGKTSHNIRCRLFPNPKLKPGLLFRNPQAAAFYLLKALNNKESSLSYQNHDRPKKQEKGIEY